MNGRDDYPRKYKFRYIIDNIDMVLKSIYMKFQKETSQVEK